MSDVRRVRPMKSKLAYGWTEDPNGTHYLLTAEEYERLRKVVDAVRDVIFESRVTIMGTIETQWAVVEALRELEDSDE